MVVLVHARLRPAINALVEIVQPKTNAMKFVEMERTISRGVSLHYFAITTNVIANIEFSDRIKCTSPSWLYFAARATSITTEFIVVFTLIAA